MNNFINKLLNMNIKYEYSTKRQPRKRVTMFSNMSHLIQQVKIRLELNNKKRNV
jgi:hypothetical protein